MMTHSKSIHDEFPINLVENVVEHMSVRTAFRFHTTCKASATSFIKNIAEHKKIQVTKNVLCKLFDNIKEYALLFDDDTKMRELIIPLMKALYDRFNDYHNEPYFTRILIIDRMTATLQFIQRRTELDENTILSVWASFANGVLNTELEQNHYIFYNAFKEYAIGERRTFELCFDSPNLERRFIFYMDFIKNDNKDIKVHMLMNTRSNASYTINGINYMNAKFILDDETLDKLVVQLHKMNGNDMFMRDIDIEPIIFMWPRRYLDFPPALHNLYSNNVYNRVMKDFMNDNFQRVRTSDFW